MASVESVVVSIPRESMVTVRLSDVELSPDHLRAESENDVSLPDSTPSTRTTSFRSSRRSSTSSATNSVDWEGLEKSEEQEFRDKSTDDVGYYARVLKTF